MSFRMPVLAVAVALLPSWVIAEEPPATGPSASTASPAPAPAAAAAPVAPATTPPAAKSPEPEYSSYAVLKGGWFGSSGDYQGSSFDGSGTWEVAVGTGRTFGVELGVGRMSTSASGLEVDTVPILLSLRFQLPIAILAPFAELGAGAYYNKATVAGATQGDWTAGWHAGLGLDVHLGRLLVGAQARYMGIAPTFSTVGTVTLDRYALLLRAGVRF